MKKTICIVIVLLSLFLVSCGDAPVVYSTPTESTAAVTIVDTATELTEAASTSGLTGTATIATTTSTTGGTTPAEVFVSSGYARISAKIIETKSKIMILEGIVTPYNAVCYYSKADGEVYPFCFDPFCDHEDKEMNGKPVLNCVGYAMSGAYRSGFQTSPLFINSRFYFIVFDSIYSSSEFATDLRLEFSFHEYDHLTMREIINKWNLGALPICDFFGDGANIFFKHIDESGKVIQYRYETTSKKLYNLTEKIEKAKSELGMSIYIREFLNGKIYFDAYTNVTYEAADDGRGSYQLVTGDFAGYYETDYEFEKLTKVDFVFPPYASFKTNDGIVSSVYDAEKDQVDLILVRYNGEKKVLIDNESKTLGGKDPQFLYLTDNCVYYITAQPVEIGYDKRLSGKMRENYCGGKLYRYDFETGKIQLVLDDLKYDYSDIFYISKKDGIILFSVQKYEKISATEIKSTGGVLLKAALDANGNFVDIEEVELE